jgi:hypothetical protein
MADIRVENHGSVVLLRPLTERAWQWFDENVEVEGWQFFGGAIAAEPRYIPAVVGGARLSGLEVE